jgi:hypothetical protein
MRRRFRWLEPLKQGVCPPRGGYPDGSSRNGPNALHDFGNRPGRRETHRQHPLDLGLPLMRRERNQLRDVFGGEMRREKSHRSQVQAPLSDRLEQPRKLPRCSGRVDAVAGYVLGHVQLFDAIREHRRIAVCDEQSPRIELGDVGQQDSRRRAVLSGDGNERATQGCVAQVSQRASGHEVPIRGGGAGRAWGAHWANQGGNRATRAACHTGRTELRTQIRRCRVVPARSLPGPAKWGASKLRSVDSLPGSPITGG